MINYLPSADPVQCTDQEPPVLLRRAFGKEEFLNPTISEHQLKRVYLVYERIETEANFTDWIDHMNVNEIMDFEHSVSK